MMLTLEAACGCDTGKRRKNNEDNFLFASRCLEEQNDGLERVVSFERKLDSDLCVAVFDGMGGENFGEMAAYAAAARLKQLTGGSKRFFDPCMEYVTDLMSELNDAVVAKAADLRTEHMGSTVVALFLHRGCAYFSSLGDSRGYRLQRGVLQQITEDHLEKNIGNPARKRPLTQHLGIPADVMRLDPFVAKDPLTPGDQFLLCSDGLTDMLSDEDIRHIMTHTKTAAQCVEELIAAALEKGGRDNVTVIICRIK